jgi:protein-S-isoprenylcysteine O-methyltransferase Ste14
MTSAKLPARVLRRATLSSVGFLLVLAAILFLPAGVGWRRGWVFFVTFILLATLSAAFVWRRNPEVFAARSTIHKGTESWDKPLLAVILMSFFAVFVIASFDARYHWSSVPTRLVVLGYVLFVLGFVLSTWVYAVNKYAEPSVRIQLDRGQKVVDNGPYAFVRHPLYLFSIVMIAGIVLALGSYWAFIPFALGFLDIVVRTVLEDRLLHNKLEGYRDYATRVRYKLLPGVW